MKEYVQEHRLRKDLLDTTDENGEEVEDDLAVADLDDDDDMEDEDEASFEGIPKQQTPLQQEQPQPQSTSTPLLPRATLVLSPPPPQPIRQLIVPPQKSILKSQGSYEESVPSTPVSVASKKVCIIKVAIRNAN